MKVLLVNPTKERLFEQPSLGLLYIAAALRKAGHQVRYMEGSGETLETELYSYSIVYEPDVIGFTVMSPMFNEVKDAIHYINYIYEGSGRKKPILIAGGAHATLMPETLLEAGVDYVIQGEGEETMPNLVKWIQDGQPDLSPHPVQKIWKSPVIQDLDKLAFPARDLLPEKYRKRHAASIMASRGCPYNCCFCQPTLRKMFGSTVRRRSVWNVLEEMNQCYSELGIRYFEFFDDTFTADREWVYDFCESFPRDMPSEKKAIRWECLTRVNTVTETLLAYMKAAGCHRITFGVESGCQEILDYYRKGITVEQVKEAFRLCRKVGIHTHALFMLGAPMETKNSIWQTEQLIREIQPDSIFISITTPLPFTDLWDDCMKNGNVTLDWSQINYYQKPALKLQFMEPGEIVAARERILKGFYLRHPWFVVKMLRARGWSYFRTAVRNLF